MQAGLDPENRLLSARLDYPVDTTPVARRAYRRRSLGNLFTMFHCAPSVMKTVLDAAHSEQEWPVKLTAGMPGGIGNTGRECGAFTSPLLLLGLRYGLGNVDRGLPLIFYKGCYLHDRFLNLHHSLNCREIQGGARVPLACISVASRSPELLVETIAADCRHALPDEKRAAYSRLYGHLSSQCFHCAHAVFKHLAGAIPVTPELLDSASGFVGGTLFLGRTCSAFSAAVMAVGLVQGEIENSFPRVARMLAIMALGGNAFGDDLNKFHPMMNTGYRLSRWFKAEFGSLLCGAITGCEFSTQQGVQAYIDAGSVTHCQEIARRVAEKAGQILDQRPAFHPSQAS